MDSAFVWILMSAGAAVALLGLFLVASERELKTKRHEIEELLMKLENGAAGAATAQSLKPQADHAAELSELRAQNRELQNELTALAGKFELSRRTINDLEASQQGRADDPADTQRLRAANEQLNRDATELRTRLGQERQSLQERIAQLERRLLTDQEKLSELQTMRDRLAEADSIRTSLQEEIRRHEAELPLWQARIAEAEENGQRLAALQLPCNELLSKQAALAEGQRQLQEELASFARLIGPPAQATQPLSSVSSSSVTSSVENGAPNQTAAGSSVTPEAVHTQAEIARPEQTKTA
ncbi:MAG: hypothetical protein ACREQ2_01595 [Candidatus Binatia bacterium]